MCVPGLSTGYALVVLLSRVSPLVRLCFGEISIKNPERTIDIDEDDYFLTFSGRRSETSGFFEMFIMQGGLSHDNDVHLEIMYIFMELYTDVSEKL